MSWALNDAAVPDVATFQPPPPQQDPQHAAEAEQIQHGNEHSDGDDAALVELTAADSDATPADAPADKELAEGGQQAAADGLERAVAESSLPTEGSPEDSWEGPADAGVSGEDPPAAGDAGVAGEDEPAAAADSKLPADGSAPDANRVGTGDLPPADASPGQLVEVAPNAEMAAAAAEDAAWDPAGQSLPPEATEAPATDASAEDSSTIAAAEPDMQAEAAAIDAAMSPTAAAPADEVSLEGDNAAAQHEAAALADGGLAHADEPPDCNDVAVAAAADAAIIDAEAILAQPPESDDSNAATVSQDYAQAVAAGFLSAADSLPQDATENEVRRASLLAEATQAISESQAIALQQPAEAGSYAAAESRSASGGSSGGKGLTAWDHSGDEAAAAAADAADMVTDANDEAFTDPGAVGEDAAASDAVDASPHHDGAAAAGEYGSEGAAEEAADGMAGPADTDAAAAEAADSELDAAWEQPDTDAPAEFTTANTSALEAASVDSLPVSGVSSELATAAADENEVGAMEGTANVDAAAGFDAAEVESELAEPQRRDVPAAYDTDSSWDDY